MMPDKRSRTFNFTWMKPVTHPARAPARKERIKVRAGLTPASMAEAVRAAGLEVLEINHQGEWVSVTARKN